MGEPIEEEVHVIKPSVSRGPKLGQNARAGASLRIPDDDPDQPAIPSDATSDVDAATAIHSLDGHLIGEPMAASPYRQRPGRKIEAHQQATIPEEVDLDVNGLSNATNEVLTTTTRFGSTSEPEALAVPDERQVFSDDDGTDADSIGSSVPSEELPARGRRLEKGFFSFRPAVR